MSQVTSRRGRRCSQRILNQRVPDWLRSDCDRLVNNDPDLQVLLYSGKWMGEECAEALGMALGQNKTVTELFLGWNEIGDHGVEAISEGLEHRFTSHEAPILTELNLAFNSIGHQGVLHLVKALGSRKGGIAQTLNLSSNIVGNRGASRLAEWLSEENTNNSLQHLTSLCLGSNAIGNGGAVALGNVLKCCRNLKDLYLNENLISENGACALSAGLSSDQCGLEALDLRANNIGNGGAVALGNALAHNTSLKILCLSLTRIDRVGLEAIAKGLSHNEHLETLTLLRNHHTLEGATALLDVLQTKNTTLKWLYLYPRRRNNTNTPNQLLEVQTRIDFYCALNRVGRNHIGNVSISWSLWPRFFGRLSHDASLLYWFLREKPELFSKRCKNNVSETEARQAKKRKRESH